MRHDSFINLDMHCSEGRCLVQLGLDAYTPAEREWLFGLLQQAKEGRKIQFGVNTEQSGQVVLKFTLEAREMAQ